LAPSVGQHCGARVGGDVAQHLGIERRAQVADTLPPTSQMAK
jgi:hypothetical protein